MRTKAAVAASLVLDPRPCAPCVYTRVHPHVYGVCMACAQASLVLDPSISVREAHAIGASVRTAVLRQVPGLLEDMHPMHVHPCASSHVCARRCCGRCRGCSTSICTPSSSTAPPAARSEPITPIRSLHANEWSARRALRRLLRLRGPPACIRSCPCASYSCVRMLMRVLVTRILMPCSCGCVLVCHPCTRR